MSFKRRNVDQQPKLPPGSRLSAYNGQLLISTGVPSLDDILGGGLPVGTVLLVKEDRATSYAQLLLKYFLAQGIASGHNCALASRDDDPEELLRNLMWLANAAEPDDDDDVEATKASRSDNDRMKIAWRYSHLKKFGSSIRASSPTTTTTATSTKTTTPTTETTTTPKPASTDPPPYCSLFDLTKRIPQDILDEARTTIIDRSTEFEMDDSDDYGTLLDDIRQVVVKGGFSSAIAMPPNTPRNALRIGIHSLASPSWRCKSAYDVYKFFHALRGLLRFSFGAALVTIPAYLYDNPSFIRRIEHMVDGVIGIESFAGSPVHNDAPYTQNYHGFFHVDKLPVLNSLLPPSTKLSVLSGGGSNDLAFKLRRKRFTIETFHLPPEGGVSTRRTEPPPEDKTKKTKDSLSGKSLSTTAQKTNTRRLGVGCGSLPGKKDPLEF
ncbi:Elongator subunit elp4 [Apophysomyces ossiformis]|uniref:Elongator complex protein 4 n=1 Tax=Apophysomyces ossiformis TaxID=679940 RepID=A0A8H7BS27_9FUNG|nr:Elongator subunit elp4 [Apophysomyces ossiformis]